MSSKTPIRTTTNGKPAPFVPVKSGTTLAGSSLGNKGRSVSNSGVKKGGAYMKKSKRKSMKKSRKARRN